jgi:hypothetical protein
MKHIKKLLHIVAFSCAVVFTTTPAVAQNIDTSGLTICNGQFALCAASACKPTGGTITNSAGVEFPEVICSCPILKGNLADVNAGNMQGSCAPTDENHVWSTFWPRFDYPRQQNDFSHNPKEMRASIQECPAELKQGANASNCFSWNCEIDKNGVAMCSCPMGQNDPETAFLIETVPESFPQRCFEHPVSLPLSK